VAGVTGRADPGSAAPVRQRLVLISRSTGRFHSRAERMATSAVRRGHEVTLVALWQPGLPVEERHPAGFRILRPPVRTLDGLPLGGLVRRLWPGLEEDSASGSAQWAMPTGPSATPTGPAAPGPPAPAPARRRPGPVRRRVRWLVDRVRLPLTIRAQTRVALTTVPAADVYIGMAFAGIPVALALAKRHRARAVYDVTDVYLEARNLARTRGPLRAWLRRTERGWARASAAMTTANEPYADLIADRLGAGRPTVILNTPPRYAPPADRPRRFHEALALDPATRVVLFHGGLVEDRGVEQLIAAVPLVPDAVLVLMGYGPLVPVVEAARADPGVAERVRLLPAVAPSELVDWVASADVVAMPIQPTTLNHRFTTPNRLFEAIAAGTPILAADLPGMAAVVRELDGGVLVDPTDPAAIAAGLRDLLGRPPAAVEAMRARLLAAAHDRYCWEVEEAGYLALLGRVTGRPW
jgi:glycosyltransferase involved in cell wall biosynthesis